AAQIDIVLARRAAGEADLGQVRAGAAVGAAGHADHDRLLGEPMPLDDGFQLGDQGSVLNSVCEPVVESVAQREPLGELYRQLCLGGMPFPRRRFHLAWIWRSDR